jgi:hypothetical protein
MPIKLADLPIPSVYKDALLRLGYDTLESLRGLAEAARPALNRYLGGEINVILSALPSMSGAFESNEWQRLRNVVLSKGAFVGQIEVLTAAPFIPEDLFPAPVDGPSAGPATVVNAVNLVSQMPPIRDQQQRGTCVAHAVLAAFEHSIRSGPLGPTADMSEQFLYWNCKANDGIPNLEGTWIRVAAPLLRRDGVCRESTWSYVGNPIPGNEGQGPAPTLATAEAPGNRPASVLQLPSKSIAKLKAELLASRCVPFSIPVFDSWYLSPHTRQTGQITLPLPGENSNGGHAMCLVGFQTATGAEDAWMGGGYFILRNSWGTGNWGVACPFGAGYGTIPFSYIAQFCSEAYSIR